MCIKDLKIIDGGGVQKHANSAFSFYVQSRLFRFALICWLTQLFTHTSMHSFLVFPFGCSPGHSAWIPLITTNNCTSISIAHLLLLLSYLSSYHHLQQHPQCSPVLGMGSAWGTLFLPLSALGWHVMVALVLFSSSPLLY